MLPIIVVRRPWSFYFLQLLVFIIISGIGCGIASRAVLKINSAASLNRGDYLGLALGGVFVFLAVYMVFRYFKNAPSIIAGESSISFGGREVYALADILDIRFTGKVPLHVLWSFPVEGTRILLKNGTEKYIYDDFYPNTWELKSFLKQRVVDKKIYEPIVPQDATNNDDPESIVFFKGNPILSFSPIMAWTLIACASYLGYIMIQRGEPGVIFIGLAAFLFLALSSSLNYFGLSNNYFIVRNHHFLWMRHAFRIENIKEIIFETTPRGPNRLRIITHDFRSKIYGASTLREKHWLALMNKLMDKGIVVRDECIKPNG
ncbi:hypothetical protein [Daejeonella sp. JGW-45]|uniref:hypothetical protein n=1 Tax=Daejeonella sp. JGW-45 TaxID=3034148 RepID=UPI0023EAAC97|nr:hypothetical protein [Daejeonella sp. JGW-45]